MYDKIMKAFWLGNDVLKSRHDIHIYLRNFIRLTSLTAICESIV
jgi:hypothetical protein